MDYAFESGIQQFIAPQFRELDRSKAAHVERLELIPLLRERNPYLDRLRRPNLVSEVVDSLLDRASSSIEEDLFDIFLKDLAVFVSEEKCNGRKSGITGIDIELERAGVRYLIAVKSGKTWGNAAQHKKLRDNFLTAVRVLRQNRAVGEIQPTLGICYGRFKTVNNGAFLHIGGQSFWQLISGEPDLYMEIIEPIGHRAKEFNDEFHEQRANAMNRMVREFTQRFCLQSGAIDWPKIVTLVSKNA